MWTPTTSSEAIPVRLQVAYPFEFVAAGLLVEGGGTIRMSSTPQMTVLN